MLSEFSSILEELCSLDESLNVAEFVQAFKHKCKLLYTLANSFRNKYDELYIYVANELSYKEECIQSRALSRGYYHPNPITEMIIGGCKRGKLSKRAKKPCFEYWFDNKNRLIHSIQFDYYSLENDNMSGEKKVVSNEFILHYNEYQICLSFIDKDLIGVDICKYNCGKIIQRINTDSGLLIDFKSVISIRFEKFDYDENGLFKFYEYSYMKTPMGYSVELLDSCNSDLIENKRLDYFKKRRNYLFSHNEVTFYRDRKTNKITHYIYDEFLENEVVSKEEYKVYTDIDV